MIMVILATMAALVLCTIFSAQSMMELQSRALETMETDERDSYDEQIKQQVDNVITLCQTIYDQYQEGVYTEAEAKKLAADEIRQLRYGDSGYFWIDQYDGTNVVLLGSATEGTNRMETEDANGYQMVKEIIRVGQEPDGGYVDYVFPKEGETESSPKRSYSKAFEPFQWVIGTGNYTADRCQQFFGGCREIRYQSIDLTGIITVRISHTGKCCKAVHHICSDKSQQLLCSFCQIVYSIHHILGYILDMCNGCLGLFCQYTDLLRHHSKSFSGFSCTCCLNGSIQCQ
jgi:signal transduction histidine kinase